MLNVMLVDDNKSVLEGLIYLIDWESYGYNVAAAVRNGKEALRKIDELMNIDLVITDIRMPQMTGLELITGMKQKKSDLKFVLISGYSEFDYAKWAIDNQISGYLLKPVDENELIDTITNIRKTIMEERENQLRQRNYYLKNVLMGKNEYIEELLWGKNLKNARYCMIRPYEKNLIVSNYERYNFEYSNILYDEISNLINENNDGYALKNDFAEIEIIMGHGEGQRDIKSVLLSMERKLKEKCKFDFVFLAGKETDVNEIKESKQSLNLLEDNVFYEENKSLFIYDNYTDEEFFEFLPDTTVPDALIHAIKNGFEEEVKKAVSDFCDEVKSRRIKMKSVLRYVNNMIFEVCNTISENGGDSTKYLYRCSMLEKESYLRFEKVCIFLEENALEICKIFRTRREKSMFGAMGHIIDYINDNYSNENLNLQYLAQKYHITAAYLGKLFKQKTKMSFNNYLLQIRIEKAKELLKNSDYKIYEVAYAVGFSDPNYFTVKFLSAEKITPAKYRELLNSKKEE